MPHRFYEFYAALEELGQWLLFLPPEHDDNYVVRRKLFAAGRIEPVVSIEVGVARDGIPQDMSQTSDGRWVVSSRAANLIESVAGSDVQWLPAQILAERGRHGFQLMHIVTHIDCLDEDKSKLIGRRGRGRFTGVVEPVVKREMLLEHQLCRITTFTPLVIASQAFKDELEQAGLTGFHFREVRLA